MTFSRIRAFGAWLDGGVLDETELEAFDDARNKSIDGFAGGAYAPSAQLVIGGAFPLSLTSGLNVDAGPVGITETLGVAGDAIFYADVAVFGTANFTSSEFNGAVTFNDVANFADDLHVAGILYADGSSFQVAGITLTSSLEVLTSADFDGTVNVDGVTTVNDAIVLAGTSNIRRRVTQATDANASYQYEDVVNIPDTVPTAARTFTLLDVTGIGSEMTFENWSSYVMTIKNSGGATIGVVPVLQTGLLPGRSIFRWAFNGGLGTQWHCVSKFGT